VLTRENFDQETLAALDEIALLLHIKMSVQDMNRTLKNSDSVDGKKASPSAKRVMRVVRSAARELLEETFVRKDKRDLR